MIICRSCPLTPCRSRPNTASFGFSFTIAAPTSSQPEPTEPPSKRRKTTEPEGLSASREEAGGSAIAGDTVDNHGVSKTKRKSRRRLPVDTGENAQVSASFDAGDDSFVTQARSKTRKRARNDIKTLDISEEIVSAAQDHVVSKEKSRIRQDITKAIAEVMPKANTVVYEEKCSDHGNSTSLNAAGRIGNDVQALRNEDCVLSDTSRTRQSPAEAHVAKRDHDGDECPSMTSRSKRQTRQKSSTKRVEHQDAPIDMPDDNDARMKKATRKKRQQPTRDAMPMSKRNLPRPASTQQCGDETRRTATVKVHDGFPTPEEGAQAPAKSLDHNQRSHVPRQALTETDVNVARPSVSPEKRTDRTTIVVPPRSKQAAARSATSTGLSAPVEEQRARSRRPRTQAARDESMKTTRVAGSCPAERVATEPDAEWSSGVTQTISARDAEPNVVRDTGSRDRPNRAATAGPRKTKEDCNPRPQRGSPARSHVEEDIDWLFTPQEARRAPTAQAPSVIVAVKHSKANSGATPADIDLDDLVSNIASFASVRPVGVTSLRGVRRGRVGKGPTT